MATRESLTALVDQLIQLFNQRSMDLPDGYFDEMLGRSPQDPLVLMITRGAAGYRFTAKAVQHAVPDAQLVRGELREQVDGESVIVTGQCWLSGHYRGTQDPVELLADVELRLSGNTLLAANVTIDPALLERLHAARRRN
jgi:hypothetical protein